MRSRLLVNLLLLLMVIGLGTLYYLQPAEPAKTPSKISQIDTDQIRTIRIERPDADTIALQKTDNDWRLTAPIRADAADDRIASTLLLPISDSKSRYPATDKQLEQFGLAPAQLTLHYDDQTFVVGDKNPLNQQQRYVLYDDQIHVIDGRLYQRLNAPLNYYVNPSLTPPDSQITRLKLPRGIISQQGKDWRIVPDSLSEQPGKLVEHWQQARASYLQQMDSPPDDGRDQITIEFAEHDPITYQLVETKPQIILARPAISMQYHLQTKLGEQLRLVEPQDDKKTARSRLPATTPQP